MFGKRCWIVCLMATAAAAVVASAQAAEPAKAPPSIWEQDTLTGDWGGARSALKDRGVTVGLNYIGETFGVLSGGIDRRTTYEGRVEFSIDADLQKLIGWTGSKTHVTVYQIHNSGHNVVENTESIADPSNIDALSTTRLFTAWFEQSFGDRVSLRVGQLAADDEFFTSDTAGGLINGTFGWPGILASDTLHSGPAYPLAVPGARLKLTPTDDVTVLAAVFTGDPAGPNCTASDDNNPQKCNRYGTAAFGLDGGSLWVGEVQYAVNQGKQAVGLPGVYKFGAWYATANFLEQHYGFNASGVQVSLADPTLAFNMADRGNGGVYAIADQMVWRGAASSVNLFVRGGAVPSDRNLVSYYVDGGVGIKGLLPGRADDTLTVGAAYAKISPAAVALDRDFLAFNGPPYAVRSAETLLEVSYAAQLAPWWIVQPDLQYIWHPSGGQNPDDPTLTLDHAFVAGIRSTIKF